MTSPISPEELHGAVALITGAGAGIGRATARRLAAGGAHVVLTDKHQGRLDEALEAVRECDPVHEPVAHLLDIEKRDDFDRVFAAVEDALGPIGIYVWNAALNVPMPIFDYDPELFDRITTANVGNCWYSCRTVSAQMARSGGGSIVLIGSMMLGIARAGGPSNIRCNEVVMAYVEGTRFADSRPETAAAFAAQTPLQRNATTDDIAEAVAFLASERAAFVSGDVMNVTGGYFGSL